MESEFEEQKEAVIDFIPTICFVKRGVTKEKPDKVVLSPEELARVINEVKDELEESEQESSSCGDDDDEIDNDDDESMNMSYNAEENMDDEFDFDQYDKEENAQVASIGSIAVFDENTPIVDDEDDSEAEDDIIKPTDNIMLVGHVIDDCSTMEFWVFNEEEESLYTHHEILLPSFPLCIEWLSHDPGNDNPGNMCAVGHIDPIITLWDLDIQDSFEPTFKLGSKGSRKRNLLKYGHKDSVLDLSWNTHFSHILASCSIDKTVILWDLDIGRPHTSIIIFKEKVQSIKFHPNENELLLTGSSDGYVRLFDCRDRSLINTSFKKWEMKKILLNECQEGGNIEIEKVVWNPNNPNYFSTGMNNGLLAYSDIRKEDQILWYKKAHDDEVSDICFNSQINNLMTTSSADGYFKIWNFDEEEIKEVYRHDFSLGRLQCMKQCPEDPFTFAFGGEKSPKIRVYNIKNFESVRTVFLNEENI